MQVINYPGNICLGINKIICLSPVFFKFLWRLVFAFISLFLIGNTFIKLYFPKTVESRKFLRSVFSPEAFIVLLCLGIFILRIPNLILSQQNIDESQWIATGATYLNGAVLWKTISGATGGPLVFIFPTIMVPFDGLNFVSLRLFGLLFCVLPCVYFLWKTLRLLYGAIIAQISMIGLFIFLATINSSDFIAYNSEHICICLIAVCLYLFFKLSKNGASRLDLISLGIFLGLIPYAKLQAVPIGFCIGIFVLLGIFQRKDALLGKRYLNFIVFTFSAFIPFFLFGIYLTTTNSWMDFLSDYILSNSRYSETSNAVFANYTHGMVKLWILPKLIIDNRFLLLFISIQVFTVLLVAIVYYRDWRAKRSLYNSSVLSIAVITIVSYLSVILTGNSFLHYLYLFIVPFVLFSGILIGAVSTNGNSEIPKNKYGFIIFAGILIYFYVGLRYRDTPMGLDFAVKKDKYSLSIVSKEIIKYAQPGERMSIWGWAPIYHVETGLIQGNKYSNSFYSMLKTDGGRKDLSQYIEEMRTNNPVIFLDDVSKGSFVFNDEEYEHENYPLLNKYISGNYTQVCDIEGKRVFVLNRRLAQIDSVNFYKKKL